MATPQTSVDPLSKLSNKARGKDDIKAFFSELSVASDIQGTKARVEWHIIVQDQTGKPSIDKLVYKLSDLFIDFALPRSDSNQARKLDSTQGTSQNTARLFKKARKLFTTANPSGEAGELLLYYLAEQHLRYPQLLAKFSHKTNPMLHANGADGIHASVSPTTKHLRLHWGEAKLYNSPSEAMNDCFDSLSEIFGTHPNPKKSKDRDIELIRDYMDVCDEELEAAILTYLDPNNEENNHIEYCGIALVGFDIKDYSALTAEYAKGETVKIQKRVDAWLKSLTHYIQKHNVVSFKIDIFLIPFESVDNFRAAFDKELS